MSWTVDRTRKMQDNGRRKEAAGNESIKIQGNWRCCTYQRRIGSRAVVRGGFKQELYHRHTVGQCTVGWNGLRTLKNVKKQPTIQHITGMWCTQGATAPSQHTQGQMPKWELKRYTHSSGHTQSTGIVDGLD